MSAITDLDREFTRAIGTQDVEGVTKLYAPNAVVYDPQYPEPLRGQAAIRKDYADFVRAFPDLRFEITSEFEKGDAEGASEFRFTGTHKGPMSTPQGEIPPTNKRLDMRGAAFIRLSGGKIAEERRYYDIATLMRQLGLSDETAEAPGEAGARA